MNKLQAFCFSLLISTVTVLISFYCAFTLATSYPYKELSLICVVLVALAVFFTSYACLIRRGPYQKQGQENEWAAFLETEGKGMLHPVKAKQARTTRF